MFKAHTMSRRGLRAAAGLGAAVASLAFAGVASAAVQVISPDQPLGGSCPASATSSNLTTAIQNATSSTNTIVLTPGIYCPVDPSGQSTISIAHNLNIVADHSYQGTGGLANFEVVGIDATGANDFTIASGVNVVLEGFNIDLGGQSGGNAVVNNGSLTTWGMTFDGNYTPAIDNAVPGATAVLNQSTVSDGIGDGLVNYGSMTLRNVSLLNNSGHAVDFQPGSTTNAYNTLIANNGQPSCFLGKFTNNPAPGSLDDDGSCGVQYSDNTDVDNYVGASATVLLTGANYTNGGPASTTSLAPNNDTTLKGNSTYCATVDERFFVNPVVGGVIKCDIGAVTGSLDPNSGQGVANSATQETAAPLCHVTGGVTGVSQNVTLSDATGGIGPEIGLDTDNPSNTIATIYPPSAAVPVAGYDVSNLQINNGSVSFTSPTAPTTSGVVLTAGNKTTAGVNNSNWSFTGLNWAGVATNCF